MSYFEGYNFLTLNGNFEVKATNDADYASIAGMFCAQMMQNLHHLPEIDANSASFFVIFVTSSQFFFFDKSVKNAFFQ